MITEIIVQKSLDPLGYNFYLYVDKYEPNEFVIIQVDYKYYFAAYVAESELYRVQLQTSRDVVNENVSIPVRGILYNYISQSFVDVKKGIVFLSQIANNELLSINSSLESDTTIWTENLLVSEIAGPFQNGKIVDVLDLKLPVYYLGTPSSRSAHDSQILTMKWEYQYNSEEPVPFIHSKRTIVEEQGVKKLKLECSFHNRTDIESVTVYPFYRAKSSKVVVVCKTENKKIPDDSYSSEVEENNLNEPDICCKIDESYFFSEYDKKFDKKKLTDSNKISLRAIFRSISDYYNTETRSCKLKHIAYMLATIKHETAHTFNPINEYGGDTYFEEMYDPVLGKNEERRKMAVDNGNTAKGDGVKYHGRGYVQLTWKNNYKVMKDKFKVDLINSPEKALGHDLAMKILIYGSEQGTFTGVRLSNYINDKKTDYLNARRVINGTDANLAIKEIAIKIEACLKVTSNCSDKTNEFGLVQLTKMDNANIVNYGMEDSYIYKKIDGKMSSLGQHGDDWIKPDKAKAFSIAVNNLVKEYPNQKIFLNDCSAYNPAVNLGHDPDGAHSKGEGFDCKFLTVNCLGSKDINSLTDQDKKINGRFVTLLKETKKFTTFYSDKGKIPGTTHSSGHTDHLHGE